MHIFGNLEARCFDTRRICVTLFDLKKICEQFGLGLLDSYQTDRDLPISHSNFIFFLRTSRGPYVLKFHPHQNQKSLFKEFVLSTYLRNHGFATPRMHRTTGGKPFVSFRRYLVTCYDKILGQALYATPLDAPRLKTINQTVQRLNSLLCSFREDKRLNAFLDQEDYRRRLSALNDFLRQYRTRENRTIVYGPLKKIISDYHAHRDLFLRQPVHTNLSLANLMTYGKQMFVLDLSHIALDYELNDIAGLICSFYACRVPEKTIKFFIEDCRQCFSLEKTKLKTLYHFCLYRLMKEYLKLVQKEKKLKQKKYRGQGTELFRSEIEKQKRSTIQWIEKYAENI